MSSTENSNRLGLGIIAFEGTELIAQCVAEIRDLVDYIVIGFQEHSYTGEPCDPNDRKEVETLLSEGLVDNVIYIKTDTSKFPRVQETEKRNALLDDIIAHGCSHELITDSDEFYAHDSFARAKAFVYDNDVEMSYCRYINYFHDYRHYLVYPFKDGQYVPFIAKVDYRFAWQCTDFPYPSDPTRRFVRPTRQAIDPSTGLPAFTTVKDPSTGNDKLVPKLEYSVGFHLFKWSELKMHHLSWLRADIRKKMGAWSSKSYFDNALEIMDRSSEKFHSFDPESTDTSDAYLLFNVPGNRLEVAALPKQYIFPKIDYHSRTHSEPRGWKVESARLAIDPNRPQDGYEEMLTILDSMFSNEEFGGHNSGDVKTREVCSCDWLIIEDSAKPLSDKRKTELIEIVDRLSDDSVIHFIDGAVVISSTSIAKVRRYAHLEWGITQDWRTALRTTIEFYAMSNGLNPRLYYTEDELSATYDENKRRQRVIASLSDR